MIDEAQYEAMRLRERIALATAAAMFAAGVILVAVVLPADYGVDPVGTGNAFGLTQIARAEEAAGAPAAAAAVAPATGEPAPTIEGEGGRPTLAFGQPTPATMDEDGGPILEWNRAGADRLQPRPFRRDSRTFQVGPNEALEFKYRLE
jgi:hypothetical protein